MSDLVFNPEYRFSHAVVISSRIEKVYYILINTEIPKVTYYYVLILNLNLKCIINFLKVISISKDYFIFHHQERLVEWSKA